MITEKEKQDYLARIGKSGFRGVRMSSQATKPFRSDFERNGKYIYIGNFATAEEAARAYDKKAVEVCGNDAITNEMLGLLPPEKVKETELSEYLMSIATRFCKYLERRKSRTGKFLEFSREAGFRLPVGDVAQILNFLEKHGFATLSNKSQQPNLIIVRFIRKHLTQFEQEHTTKNKDTEMKQVKDLSTQSPEELEAMAKQLLELSQAKKKEIENGDQIRKTLNPLILAVCQAKGKYERLLDQQVDVMAELDNAVNALKDALKSPSQATP